MQHQFSDAGVKAVIILNTFAYRLEEILPNTPSIEIVIIAEVGDLLGTIKGAIVDFMIKTVKRMVPNYNLASAISFTSVLEIGESILIFNQKSDDLALLQYTGIVTE